MQNHFESASECHGLSGTPESRLLPLVVIIDDPFGNHFERFHRDAGDIPELQLLHRVAARACSKQHVRKDAQPIHCSGDCK